MGRLEISLHAAAAWLSRSWCMTWILSFYISWKHLILTRNCNEKTRPARYNFHWIRVAAVTARLTTMVFYFITGNSDKKLDNIYFLLPSRLIKRQIQKLGSFRFSRAEVWCAKNLKWCFSVITCNPYTISDCQNLLNKNLTGRGDRWLKLICNNTSKVLGFPDTAFPTECVKNMVKDTTSFYDQRICSYPHYFYYSVIAGKLRFGIKRFITSFWIIKNLIFRSNWNINNDQFTERYQATFLPLTMRH